MFEAGGYAHGIALIASVALIFGMVDLPFALYRTFVIKHVSVSIARV
jgi:STE24 endopeptidase